jgi:prophage antirepressor-like protein
VRRRARGSSPWSCSERNIVAFHFEGKPVRVVDREDGAQWFVASDVCRILELSDVSTATRILDADERGTSIVGTLGGDQNVTVISEPGLYKLMARSRKPEAKRFDRWVRNDVLSAIGKGAMALSRKPY